MTKETTANHPSRTDRQNCWKVRDAYFECLNEAKVLDPASEAASSVCLDLKKHYEQGCMKSWVTSKVSRKRSWTSEIGVSYC